MLESATEILRSSHQALDSEDVVGIDVIQTIRNSGDAVFKGDDWEEVSFKMHIPYVLADIQALLGKTRIPSKSCFGLHNLP